MATMLLITSEQAFCFKPCSVASAFVMAPLVIALPPAFMDFMGGSIVLGNVMMLGKQGRRIRCTA